MVPAKDTCRVSQDKADLFNIFDIAPPPEDEPQTRPPGRFAPSPEDTHGQELNEFYSDSVLLITGGTGFLGRILIQKLLRTLNVRRIFMLVRKKNTSSVQERMDAHFQDVV